MDWCISGCLQSCIMCASVMLLPKPCFVYKQALLAMKDSVFAVLSTLGSSSKKPSLHYKEAFVAV